MMERNDNVSQGVGRIVNVQDAERRRRRYRPSQNPNIAMGRDFPTVIYEVWPCAPPRADYPGSLPQGFIDFARPWMNGAGVVAFSGALRIPGAVHVDLDPLTKPDIAGDVTDLPRLLEGRRFQWVFADPPYGDEYNRALYRQNGTPTINHKGKSYKSDKSTYWPHRWLRAMASVLAPGGHILYLDQLCPPAPAGTVTVRRAFVFRGTNLRATCCSLYRKTGEAHDLRSYGGAG